MSASASVPCPAPMLGTVGGGSIRATAEIPEGQNLSRYTTSGPGGGCYDSVGDFWGDVGLTWADFVYATVITFVNEYK
jgi:hypothetical protein